MVELFLSSYQMEERQKSIEILAFGVIQREEVNWIAVFREQRLGDSSVVLEAH